MEEGLDRVFVLNIVTVVQSALPSCWPARGVSNVGNPRGQNQHERGTLSNRLSI